jgi:gluconolactonase
MTATLAGATRIAATDAHEGPVLLDGALYFTSVPRDQRAWIRCLDLADLSVRTVPADVVMPNGMVAGPDGSLIVCDQGGWSSPARLSRVDPSTGATSAVVDGRYGLPLNSPNDVVVRADGTIWFTDPSYGYLQGFRPRPRTGDVVYRFDLARGVLTVVADTFDKPNGLAFSPDGRQLYIADSGRPRRVVAFDVSGDRLVHERVFAITPNGDPDGLETDAAGRVYVSAPSGVHVYSPSGEHLDEIKVPGAVNFALGDDLLYITADTAVWAAALNTKGA